MRQAVAGKTVSASQLKEDYARRAAKGSKKTEWFIDNVSNKIAMTLEQRMWMVVHMLSSKIDQNINVPVGRKKSKITNRIVVTERSKKGEFPRKETSRMAKDIASTMTVKVASRGVVDGYIGTTLDYPLILELKMNRKLFVATFNAERSRMKRVLTGPIT